MFKFSSFLIFVCVMIVGCQRTFYSPPAQTMPIFSQKGEVEMNAGLSIGAPFREFSSSVAFSPVTNFGIYGSAQLPFKIFGNKFQTDSCCWGRRNGWESGVAYFKKINGDYFFQIQAGGGLAKAMQSFRYPNSGIFEPFGQDTLVRFKADETRIIINPTIGMIDKNVQIYASLGLVGVKLRNLDIETGADNSVLNGVKNGQKFLLCEPSFGLRLGNEKVLYLSSIRFSFGGNVPTVKNFGHISIQNSIIFKFGNGLWDGSKNTE